MINFFRSFCCHQAPIDRATLPAFPNISLEESQARMRVHSGNVPNEQKEEIFQNVSKKITSSLPRNTGDLMKDCKNAMEHLDHSIEILWEQELNQQYREIEKVKDKNTRQVAQKKLKSGEFFVEPSSEYKGKIGQLQYEREAWQHQHHLLISPPTQQGEVEKETVSS